MSADGDLHRRLADIESGRLGAAASIAAFEERIEALDGAIGAFVRRAGPEAARRGAQASGPLAGVPLGIKDIFDTADMETEYSSPIYAGHRPRADAALVALARRQGAFIAGKTATTEFAHLTPCGTRNPRNLSHTPGGSSSGSAAAVAAGMVAAAFGTQTAGSVIRPASFCGTAGYKPSFRLLPLVGVKVSAWSLDTAGLFAPSVADSALLADLLTGRALRVETDAPQGLRVGLYRSGIDGRADPEMLGAVETAARLLEQAGALIVEIAEPPALGAARSAQGVVQSFETAQALAHERLVETARLSPALAAALAEGAALSPNAYDEARRTARQGRRAATALFEAVDVVIAPSALGPAPRGLASTGDPAMNRLWTVTGNPCVSVPGLLSSEGMPLGVSVVARFGRDRMALSAGSHLEHLIAAASENLSTKRQ